MTEETQRQKVWGLFDGSRAVTVADVEPTGVPINTARMYFAEWKRIGAIEHSHNEGKTRYYRAVAPGGDAPREETPAAPRGDGLSLRQRAWAILCRDEPVTIADLAEAGVYRKNAETMIRYWRDQGAIRFSHREGKSKYYLRVRMTDEAPEFVRNDAKLAPRERVARNLWTAARMLKGFGPRDLAAHAATSDTVVGIDDASRFARMLLRAGYVRCTRKARPGDDVEPRYKLVRDTGPKPPVEKRVRAVWDENEGRYVHLPEGET